MWGKTNRPNIPVRTQREKSLGHFKFIFGGSERRALPLTSAMFLIEFNDQKECAIRTEAISGGSFTPLQSPLSHLQLDTHTHTEGQIPNISLQCDADNRRGEHGDDIGQNLTCS